ncbi:MULTISPECIES: BPSL1445 family SYLF domain-containing lipoprotein [Paraburkholderia]|uniref:Lipid-binding SYLF domain-containing protein n=1 Tax=Paraburkholderia silvatlantica TaxID=321895 RepID=A0A2U1A0V4_9BURK|nr:MULTISPECIES: YSC84-related protein [Paraburkholderia]MBB2926441.1 lipid-binding SYLF domain-containing protein [Paraburkholderia silvatlantica]PVY25036.1 lipid-binding SYLF domain-containing protein [Paraburkholderia silvatlantica]PXW30120.1 lipid-binding SYLF domain-containing protein [Paraburkholderia silvatlantica]PYE16690.1 lipid-binding SYLF domain-containing protein [Paraburkholderia silvatlantica]TDQ81859.1 lipid-binding SYLF domain-containing protein [Paraburkholderia silvatlantica
MKRRIFVLTAAAAAGLAAAGCSTTTSSGTSGATDAAKRQEIDAAVDGTMSRLFSTVPGSQELVAKSQGVLVFPSVGKAAFIIGGSYGQGALRVGGSTVGYYSTAAASFGLQAGVQSTAVIFLFMTQDSLDKFRNSKGWSVGGDVAVALVKVGANGQIDTRTATAPVQAIVMTNTGIMADASVAGTKVTKLDL